jgi:soluble P-type ATPase
VKFGLSSNRIGVFTMIKVNIPGRDLLELEYAVFDMNGTLTVDGNIMESTKKRLMLLSQILKIYVLTADTFGRASEVFKSLPVELTIVDKNNGQDDKLKFIEKLGVKKCVAFGNGYNDIKMLKKACLGIAVIGEEGLNTNALINSDICVKNINDGLDLLLIVKRLIATLRK